MYTIIVFSYYSKYILQYVNSIPKKLYICISANLHFKVVSLEFKIHCFHTVHSYFQSFLSSGNFNNNKMFSEIWLGTLQQYNTPKMQNCLLMAHLLMRNRSLYTLHPSYTFVALRVKELTQKFYIEWKDCKLAITLLKSLIWPWFHMFAYAKHVIIIFFKSYVYFYQFVEIP